MSARQVTERLVGVLTLDGEAFDSIAADDLATGDALAVVFGAAALAGIGALSSDGALGFLAAALEVCLRFGLWVALAAGALVALGRADRFAPLFRTLGFATSPAALGLFVGLPWLGGVIVALQWILGVLVAWRAVERGAGLGLPEAAAFCGASLFGAFWLATRITSLFA
ncbi:hypothetical protein MYXO_02312 [Myxococcaceae bacterium]|nr:hypothetical protein MYXO_02312 [Myxococcaceae bacterium]